MLIEKVKLVKGLAPAADRFNTDPYTETINMKYAEELTFIVHHEGGTTGVATITVEAGTASDGSNGEAIPFRYKKVATGDSDSNSALTQATAAGISTVAAEHAVYAVSVKRSELPAGKPWVRAKLDETVNDPVNASVIALLSDLRYGGDDQPTAIA